MTTSVKNKMLICTPFSPTSLPAVCFTLLYEEKSSYPSGKWQCGLAGGEEILGEQDGFDKVKTWQPFVLGSLVVLASNTGKWCRLVVGLLAWTLGFFCFVLGIS